MAEDGVLDGGAELDQMQLLPGTRVPQKNILLLINLSFHSQIPSTMTTTIASFHGYAALSSTSTSSSSAADFTGKADYPVFPNAIYLSKFYLVSSQYSGLTDLDIDLYNECYLPARALPYHNHDKRDEDEATTTRTPKPDYQLDSPPCKRQAAINANCYYQDTNGTFAGLEISNEWEAQQQCYCDIYPFFDSARGCQECFKKHGGIEGTFTYT